MYDDKCIAMRTVGAGNTNACLTVMAMRQQAESQFCRPSCIKTNLFRTINYKIWQALRVPNELFSITTIIVAVVDNHFSSTSLALCNKWGKSQH
jgi:hypothetical protein